jgi:hypothetical protein
MYLVQMLLPLYDNHGRALPREHFRQVRQELTDRFGGFTAYLRAPAQGTWKEDDGALERDEFVMCEVMVGAAFRPAKCSTGSCQSRHRPACRLLTPVCISQRTFKRRQAWT